MNQNGRKPESAQPRRLSLREVRHALRRHLFLAIGVPAVLLASTLFFLSWVAPVYEATTTLRIDEDRSGIAFLDAVQSLSSGSNIGTEMEELRGRTLAEEVVDSLDLNVVVQAPRKLERSALLAHVAAARSETGATLTLTRTADAFQLTGDGVAPRAVRVGEAVDAGAVSFTLAPSSVQHERIELVVLPFSEAVEDFQETVSVDRPNREADIVSVRYEGGDRELVQAVPNLMTARFMAERNRVRTSQARSTAEFLDDQIDTLTADLNRSEDAYRRYREQYGIVSLEAEGEAQVKRLADMQANREMLAVDRDALASTMAQIARAPERADGASPYRALVGFPSLLASTAAPELLRTQYQLEAERAKLLDRRTMEDPEVKPLTAEIEALDRQLYNVATTFLAGLTAQISNLDATLAGFSSELQAIPEQELQLARLRRQAEVNEEMYKQLQLKLKEAEILAAVEDPSVRIVDPAILPREPISPNAPLSIMLALLAGLALGVGGAVMREQLDDTVRTREELQLLGGAPVLGSIPRIDVQPVPGGVDRRKGWRRGSDRIAARLVDEVAGAPVTEAYRSLRTNINFSSSERRPRMLVITSPAPGDGKSTTAANLAATMTKQGLTCLLIDADLRRGTLHESFGGQRTPGLSNVLMAEVALVDAVRSSPGLPDFLATGTLPPNPAELLGSTAMEALLKQAGEQYDMVLLDAPPMNLVTDAAVLARWADGVLVVARAGVTTRNAVSYTVEQLSSVRARVLGSVLNDADVRRERHYGSYMQGYYHAGE